MSFDGQAFGRRVAAARAWQGLEPKQVAQHLEVSPEAINRWERGGLVRPPARGQLRLLAELLAQDEQWLLEGDAPPWTSASDAGEAALSDVLREIRALDSKLDVGGLGQQLGALEGQLREVLAAVRALAR